MFCLPTVGMAHRLRYEPQQRILTLSKSTELEILIWWIYTVLILLNQEAINALCRKATIKTAGGKTGDS